MFLYDTYACLKFVQFMLDVWLGDLVLQLRTPLLALPCSSQQPVFWNVIRLNLLLLPLLPLLLFPTQQFDHINPLIGNSLEAKALTKRKKRGGKVWI
jgi:hypothetical protein